MKGKMEAIKSNQSNQKKKIKVTEATYEELIEKANDGIIIVQGNMIIYSNPYMNKMLGYRKKELTGVPFSKLINSGIKTQLVEIYGRKRKKEDSCQQEVLLKKKNGETMMVEISNSPITYAHDGINMLIVRDIKHRRRAEEDLRKTSKIESLSVFTKGIANDYNDLLTVISGYVHLAKLSLQPEEEAYPLLGKAYEASKLAAGIIRKLSFIAEGDIYFKKKVSSIDFLRQTSKLALSDTDVECDLILSDDLYSIEVDEIRMAQVIIEIIKNGVEAMSDGGKILIGAENPGMTSRGHLKDKFVHVFIKDKGKGIPKENLKKIFDPYFSTKNLCTQKGMGLGLSLCYSIIKSHNGHIRVESKEGAGTTFHIYLPIYEEKDSTTVTSIERKMLFKNKTRSVDHVKDICDIFMSK